jgi:opacity protein-like surface antigen
MKNKLLCAALAGSLGLAGAANAQEFDDRWYLSASTGYNFQDGDRRTDDALMGTLGLGKFISPNWSVEGELNYQNPKFDGEVQGANRDLLWSQYGISLDLRRHFIAEGRNWNPYLLFGLGYQRSEEEYEIASANSPADRKDGNLAAKIGTGLQGTFSNRVAVRAQLAYRVDFDDQSVAASTGPDWGGYPHSMEESYFTDLVASVGVLIPLGPAPLPRPACRSGRSHRPVRSGCVQPGSVGASRSRRVRLPDQQRHRCEPPVGSDRLRREPSARPDRADPAGLPQRDQPPYGAQRPVIFGRGSATLRSPALRRASFFLPAWSWRAAA